MRNLTFFNTVTAISLGFDWGWTFKGISINNCQVGIDMSAVSDTGALNVGSAILIDSEINNTPVGVLMARSPSSTPVGGDSLILENVSLNNVATAVEGPGGSVALEGTSGQMTIAAWGQGNSYIPSQSSSNVPVGPNSFQGVIPANSRPASLTAGGDYYERSKPQYELYPSSQFLSVRDAGAIGDGVTDDSAALINVLATAASQGKIVFFDAGDYLVTETIYVPAGSKITGESYPVILSSGSFFADMTNPQPVVQVGKSGETGTVEWSDMIVSSKGAQAGAILIEWNLAAPTSTPAGMWDVHTRVGGFVGSDLQLAQCPTTPNTQITLASQLPQGCIAAFMSMHVTTTATGLYMENCWLWTADHDVDDPDLTRISIYSGRGLLIESIEGGIWLYGTAVEHHTLYQYQLSATSNIFMGFIQTETAYYQPNPDATLPFTQNSAYNDPMIAPGGSGLALRVVDSDNILVYGAGLYSFFSNYDTTCSDPGSGENCQSEIFSIEDSFIDVYTLNTVGVTNMVTFNENPIATYTENNDGFIATIALLRDLSEVAP
jgi:glucan 1,3-beta-glucosidase